MSRLIGLNTRGAPAERPPARRHGEPGSFAEDGTPSSARNGRADALCADIVPAHVDPVGRCGPVKADGR